ncbi:MAG: TnsA endonuclease N-terminal domain-containing protein [Ktedonobacteraceae bacterium]
MTPEEFQAWSHRLQFPSETEALIKAIRSSPPVRHVRGRANNVTGRYPSPKMGVSIQFESEHVEFWAIYGMERDDDVVEFYDQSSRIPLSYHAKSGRKTTQWHTPDFFVLRRASAGWEEWKPAQTLDRLSVDQPGRYQHLGTGPWRCPPGEAYAQSLGLTYRLRSSAEYHPLEIQNLKFLQDFWAHEVPPNPELEALALAHIKAHPGISLNDLLTTYPDLPVDVIWTLLSTRLLLTNLSAVLLMNHDQVLLYEPGAKEPEEVASRIKTSELIMPTRPVAWDGRLWEIEEISETVRLRPEIGESLTLSKTRFEQFQQDGSLWFLDEASPSPTSPEVRQILEHASPRAQHEANRRLGQILAYARGEPITASRRSVQRWWTAYQSAETQIGCGYLGLLDRIARRGNRTVRLPDASMQVLEDHLQAHYAVPQAKSKAAVYRLYREACAKQGLAPIGERTFYRVSARFTTTDVITKRRGRRAAYASQPFYWLDQTTPRHGERPFALAHLDHTELDIELVSSVTGKVLDRPWATFLTDAYSRRILACYLTYDPPSYRSVMMVLRECVRRHQRLPQECLVDRGAEFGSIYFETLLTRYFVTKKDRPPGQPRTGSVIERLFGTTTTQLLHQLRGNTQASKTPRQMTHEVDPKRLAVWTLDRFSARLCQYAYDIYDQMDHPALGQSPREAFAQGMSLSGMRLHRLLAYSEDFLMLTRPTTRTGVAKVDPSRGIVINGLRYWNPLMRSSLVSGTSVAVRYEPFDMSVAYVFIGDQWLECVADQVLLVQGRSEREWKVLVDEWREQQRQHGKKRVTVNGPLLARFLEEVALEELVLLQQQRDLEGQSIREAILGPRVSVPTRSEQPEDDDDELDLTALPRYKEYR